MLYRGLIYEFIFRNGIMRKRGRKRRSDVGICTSTERLIMHVMLLWATKREALS